MIAVTFCPPCGDRVPGLPHEYTGGDATYTYVQTSPDRYDNLAGLPTYLRVEHDHGDVIVPVYARAAAPEPHYDLAVGVSVLATLVVTLVAVRALRRRRRHVPRL